MTPKEIKAKLKANGYSIKMIAEIINKSDVAVGQVINKQAASREIAEAVAKAVGESLFHVFPDVPSYHRSKSELRQQKKAELTAILTA